MCRIRSSMMITTTMMMTFPRVALALLTFFDRPQLSAAYSSTVSCCRVPRQFHERFRQKRGGGRGGGVAAAAATSLFPLPLPSPSVRHHLPKSRKRNGAHASLFAYSSYGRGAEIWPPPIDGDRPLDLSDSFPAGMTPTPEQGSAAKIGSSGKSPPEPKESKADEKKRCSYPRTWTRTALLNSVVRRLLQRAAALDEDQALFLDGTNKDRLCMGAVARSVPKLPAVLALTVAVLRAIKPVDVLGVTLVAGYIAVLCVASQLTRQSDCRTPTCPALPPQGHVPLLVRSPLGPDLSHSAMYSAWRQLGVLLGLILPVVLSLVSLLQAAAPSSTTSDLAVVAATAAITMRRIALRSVFVQSCQVVTESVICRRFAFRVPLPVRVLVPVLYNFLRLPYLWIWNTVPFSAGDDSAVAGGMGLPMGILGLLNLLYTATNLFGFLLPIVVMRYLRAHFFAVEAEQVTFRSGMEETIGLVPPPSS